MGIQGLLPFLDSAAEEVHISRFSGSRCAIDGYAWLHRGSKTCALEMAKGMRTTGYVDYCVKQLLKLRSFGVEPVLVLDGAALPAKAGTEEARRASRRRHMLEADALLKAGERARAMDEYGMAVDITPAHAFQVVLACRRLNVLTFVAPYEADAQIAFLARHGHVQLVLAEDSDMMAFGCPAVLYKMDSAGNGRLLRRDRLPDIVDSSARGDGETRLFSPWAEWDERLFLELCILAGCDYLPSLPGFGIKSAHRALKAHRCVETVARVRRMEMREPPPEGWDEYTKAFQRALETFRHQRVFDPSLNMVVPLTPQPVDEHGEAAPMPHCGADMPQELALAICARGELHPQTHQPFALPGQTLHGQAPGRRLSAPASMAGAAQPSSPRAGRGACSTPGSAPGAVLASAGWVNCAGDTRRAFQTSVSENGACGIVAAVPPTLKHGSMCAGSAPFAAFAACVPTAGRAPVPLPQQTTLRGFLQPVHKTAGALRAFKRPKRVGDTEPQGVQKVQPPPPVAKSRFFKPSAGALAACAGCDEGVDSAATGSGSAAVNGNSLATAEHAPAQTDRGSRVGAAAAAVSGVLASFAYTASAALTSGGSSVCAKRPASPARRTGNSPKVVAASARGGGVERSPRAVCVGGDEAGGENAPPQAAASLDAFVFSRKHNPRVAPGNTWSSV
jgi:exonuclease-1